LTQQPAFAAGQLEFILLLFTRVEFARSGDSSLS